MSSFVAFYVVLHNTVLSSKTIALFFKKLRTQVNGLEKNSYLSHLLVKVFVTPLILTHPSISIKFDQPLISLKLTH